jgi:hypothetical protein
MAGIRILFDLTVETGLQMQVTGIESVQSRGRAARRYRIPWHASLLSMPGYPAR